MSRLLAVLGRDVSRSLSPTLHNAAARAMGLKVSYIPVSCPSEAKFLEAIKALQTLGSVGANITIPYKATALQVCQSISTTAQEIGVVNTLSFSEDGRTQGDNTDGPGLLRVLEELPKRAFERVQLLGAGGAARAAAWALARYGAKEVHICARQNADRLAAAFGGVPHGLCRIKGSTLVISSLPGDRALTKRILFEWLSEPDRPVVLDLAYGGLKAESSLTLGARAMGLSALDGRWMLVEQAALALSLWTGGEVSRIRDTMRKAIHLPRDPLVALEPFDSNSAQD